MREFVNKFKEETINKYFSKNQDKTRINEGINAPKVRVITADGESLGILEIKKALSRAEDDNLDLVEVSPNAAPPVCKIIDYGKYKYEQSKKKKEASKKQHNSQLKEIKFRPNTEKHDYDFKMKNIRKFLVKGDKVKTTIFFKGREIVLKNLGRDILERVTRDLEDIANIEGAIKMEGRSMISFFIPDRDKIKALLNEI